MKETKLQNYIAEALFKLLESYNLNDITITLLCITAGVSRMSFYRYFKNTNEVIEYFLDQKCTLFKDNFKLLCLRRNNLKEKLNYIFNFIQDNHKIFLLLKKLDFNMLNSKIFDLTIFNNNKTYENYFYNGAIINVSKHWIESGMKETPEELSNIVYNIIKKNNSII